MRAQLARWVLALIALFLACSAPVWAGDSKVHYKLMPGDRVAVKVFEDEQLSGSFTVDASGDVTLPLVGDINIGGMTLESSQTAIKTALAAGFVVSPVVSIHVEEYRPVYVFGLVKAPGVYPFRVGMTAISAIVVAGGAPNYTESALVAGSDLVAADERAGVLLAKRLELLVNIAGLESLSQGTAEFDRSKLPQDAQSAPRLDELIKNGRRQVGMLLSGHNNEMDLLRREEPQFEAQHKAIDGQLEAQTHLQQLIRKRMVDLQGLGEKGLARNTALLEQTQQAALVDSSIAQLMTAKSQSDIDESALKLKIAQSEDLFKQQIELQLGEARRSLTETSIQLANALKARDLHRQAAGIGSHATTPNSFVIYRNVEGQQQAIQATGSGTLEPGDIVEVRSIDANGSANTMLTPPAPQSHAPVLYTPALPNCAGTPDLCKDNGANNAAIMTDTPAMPPSPDSPASSPQRASTI